MTNTSQFGFFNEDLTVSSSGVVHAVANATAGIGGLTRFDGVRWTGFNIYNYGLGEDWPFPSDNSHRVYVRPSNSQLIVNPTFGGLFAKSSTEWTDLEVGNDTVEDMLEDSQGRLWVAYPGNLAYYSKGNWVSVSDIGGKRIRLDPFKKGKVWVMSDSAIIGTNGVTSQVWRIEDFPELDPNSDQFKGMVVGMDGNIWIGANTINLPDHSSLIKLDPNRKTYRIYRYADGWRFPSQYIAPVAATRDGRIWFQYDSDFGIDDSGLAWFDGRKVRKFPAPFEGQMQWGGLPHAGIIDVEQRQTVDGYQLWTSCASRGIVVLNPKYATRRTKE